MKTSLILLSLLLVLAAAAPLKKRCTFVDDGFVAKDCGYSPTPEEFAEFLAKQAAEVAELARTHPCGLTSCSRRFKRDVDFQYSQPDHPVIRKLQAESPLQSSPALDSDLGDVKSVESSQTANPYTFPRSEPSVSKTVPIWQADSPLSDDHLKEPELNLSSENLDEESPCQEEPVENWQQEPLVSGHEALGFDGRNMASFDHGSQHPLYISNGDETGLSEDSPLENRNIQQSGGEGGLQNARAETRG